MNVISSSIIYDNPLPQLRSRQSAFPYLCPLDNGDILASHQIGQAFESVDGTSYLSKSCDGGKTWSASWAMFDQSKGAVPLSDCCKVTDVGGGKLIALGYEYERPDAELPIGNPQTGGLLDDHMYFCESVDGGKTWSAHREIKCSWGPHVEASAPLTVLQNGDWVTPITGFPRWDGVETGKMCGRIAHSCDQGETWNDDTVCMEFPGNTVTCYEQRLCQLEQSGAVVVIGWNEDTKTGERMNNHAAISHDNGKTFGKLLDTGIRGQASSVCALGGNKLLAIHAKRRDTDKPGIYGYIVDLSKDTWDIQEEFLIWAPAAPIVKDAKMAEIFAFLKFGQPAAVKLADGTFLMSHWFAQDGQYKTCATRLSL